MTNWQMMIAWGVAAYALWLLESIRRLLKAMHFMMHDDFKRKHPEAFRDD